MKRASLYPALALLLLFAAHTHGFAQYPRVVLFEEFTNLTCKPCTTATPILNALEIAHANHIAMIRFHPNLPLSGDPFYNANKPQNDARQTYYGVSALPHGRADGISSVVVTQEGEVQDKVNERLAMESPVKVDVTQSREGNKVNVSVDVTAGPNDGLSGDYRLRVVAVEAHIHDASYVGNPRYNGESDFYDVMRTMVPDPDGTTVTLNAGEKKSFQMSYDLQSGWQPDQIYTIAFVQNEDSKEVVQAGSTPRPVAGITSIPVMRGYSLAQSAPNPAGDAAAISYVIAGPEHVAVTLYDAAGLLVRQSDLGLVEPGEHSTTLDLRGLPSGMYTYTLRAGAFIASRTMTVVH
ncbi:MAG TPA: Omp28-related outer membrane protein [Candidatus Kapabacteria bacterium]|nr:Omp28-related outer membrane protein [Candidatus Kapabacteria bacterium]